MFYLRISLSLSLTHTHTGVHVYQDDQLILVYLTYSALGASQVALVVKNQPARL